MKVIFDEDDEKNIVGDISRYSRICAKNKDEKQRAEDMKNEAHATRHLAFSKMAHIRGEDK